MGTHYVDQNRLFTKDHPCQLFPLLRCWARRLKWFLCIVQLLCFSSLSASPNQDPVQLKALFIINIASLIQWPEHSFDIDSEQFNVCVLGDDIELFSALVQHNGKIIQGKSLKSHLYRDETLVSKCHVLYISQSESAVLDNIITQTKKLPMLTLSDIERFIYQGGMFETAIIAQRLVFKANSECINRSELHASPNLLALAHNKKNLLTIRCQ